MSWIRHVRHMRDHDDIKRRRGKCTWTDWLTVVLVFVFIAALVFHPLGKMLTIFTKM